MRKLFPVLLAACWTFTIFLTGGWSMEDSEIPLDAPDDSVMASPEEVQEVFEWVDAAFTGLDPGRKADQVSLEVLRQDFSVLHFRESCLETPIKIGEVSFERGLGTHANSEIKVCLPAGAKTFKASVGVDNNYDTQGKRGSVEFSVEIQGREVFHSPTLHGGDSPLPVSVGLPEGAGEIILRVDTTADGPTCDQADWADAQIILGDGKVVWLDENPSKFFFMSSVPPISFTCGGVPSHEALRKWTRTFEKGDFNDRITREVQWDDTETGLRVTAVATAFKRYAAVDWVLYIENRGSQDTPILEDIQALDIQLRTGNTKRAAALHRINGDVCNERSFMPFDTTLEVGKSIQLAPDGGRSSNGAFPFFNLEYRGEGVITGVGWSGQWAASFDRSQAGPTQLRVGMEHTRLLLHPGERIRTPRILLMPWKGDLVTAHNRFRRLMLFHYSPKEDSRPVQLPVVSQCFDRYSWSKPEWATEAGQIGGARFANEVGCDTHWLDAAWFDGGFPNGVGNWSVKPKEFPMGLKPVSDACHAMGLKFVLWFEPERVAEGSLIAREHPEFVFGGEKGGLFKLNDPEARRWLTDLLSKRITENGIDIYRNDFNMDPLESWRRDEDPNRQGMNEIRYVEGLYQMWDELLARHPGLLIDNCSSGGRRIDLETCRRSVPFWRSDTSCSPGHPDWNQTQTHGLSHYVPLFMACGWTPDPYTFRSSMTAGSICQWAYLDETFPMDLAKAAIAEVKANRKYWYGDFYPLSEASTAPGQWMAYQFHRADLDEGIVLAFRHSESRYSAMEVNLKGLESDQTYNLEFSDEKRQVTKETMTGRKLMEGWELHIPNAGSLLVRYSKVR
jgi:alpha-galactosidase